MPRVQMQHIFEQPSRSSKIRRLSLRSRCMIGERIKTDGVLLGKGEPSIHFFTTDIRQNHDVIFPRCCGGQ